VNGEVKELPIPPVKPTVNAEPPIPPTPAPKPAVPVLDDPYTFPWWTKAMRDEIADLIETDVNGKKVRIALMIPLDTSCLEKISKSWALLDQPAEETDNALDPLKRRLKVKGPPYRFESEAEENEYQRLLITSKHIKSIYGVLRANKLACENRVKNNLIDKLE
jgi:hypothetical protein